MAETRLNKPHAAHSCMMTARLSIDRKFFPSGRCNSLQSIPLPILYCDHQDKCRVWQKVHYQRGRWYFFAFQDVR